MGLPNNPLVTTPLENPLVATFEGNRFRCYLKWTLAASIGATFKYVVRIPASPLIITLDRVWTADMGGVELQVMAAPTGLNVTGAQYTNRNLRGGSAKTSAVEIRQYVSSTSDGTEVDYVLMPGSGAGAGARTPVPAVYAGGSRIYAPGTDYVIILTNKVASTNFGSVEYHWMQGFCEADFIGQ